MYLTPDATFWVLAVILPVVLIVLPLGWLIVEVRRLREALKDAQL